VAPTGGPAGREEFRFRRLDKPEEFRAVEELQREAWGMGEEVPVPTALERAVQDNGGLVLGAFTDIYLAGFSLGFLGWDGEVLYHYSHMTAVRPPYQNHHLGFRLKTQQREEVLRQGLATIRWTFDPLQSRNAHLHVRRLGARPDRYLVHYYGQLDSEANRGLETDRLRVIWELKNPTVERRIEGTLPSPEEDRQRLASSAALITTEPADSGLRVPTEVTEPSGGLSHLEIPFDIALVRQHEPTKLRTWRHAVRDAFRGALDLGYLVDDFAVVSTEHERRSYYFLRPPTPTPPGPAA
jgi:predicted GNAT superfamily acetyltransferase